MNITLYVDGGFRKGISTYGIYGTLNNGTKDIKEIRIHGLTNPQGTNNVAEIEALRQGLLYILDNKKDISTVTIYQDSMYVINNMKEWMKKRIKNNGRLPSGELAGNYELLLNTYNLWLEVNKLFKVNYLWVKGHNGTYGNEEADRLATLAIDTVKPNMVEPVIFITDLISKEEANVKTPSAATKAASETKYETNEFLRNKKLLVSSSTYDGKKYHMCTLVQSKKAKNNDYNDNDATTNNKLIMLGRHSTMTAYTICDLSKMDTVINMVIEEYIRHLPASYNNLFIVNLDALCNKAIYKDIKENGFKNIDYVNTFRLDMVHQVIINDSEDLDVDEDIDELNNKAVDKRTVLIQEANPRCMIHVGLNDFNTLNKLYEKVLSNTLDVSRYVLNDITDTIYSVDKKGKLIISPNFKHSLKDLTFPVNYVFDDVHGTSSTTVRLGFGLPTRKQLNSLIKENPKVYILTEAVTESIYHTYGVVISDNCTSITWDYGTNINILKKGKR